MGKYGLALVMINSQLQEPISTFFLFKIFLLKDKRKPRWVMTAMLLYFCNKI